ncbi:prenyltransferase [Alkalicoccus daliensis]|uniref:1,4-dihydroxy-2-naphthoate octaprenyltransferase n=1 Tax=Alkalicoccus daliensis TaxID=745820 RepID=A0A1H0GXI9_9BACI|nr:prenyltransferase [Alkalicoccus daliensis]SDO11590.1 1,4-dihydroxy-2-naphthoate octaprenyltransferase [Alkalicoccus daliensis]
MLNVVNKEIFQNGIQLLRAAAVLSSSAAAVLSSLLPILLYTSVSPLYVSLLFLFLIFASFLVHGVLTHAFNDFTDYHSGTDQFSPAILSGGSRLIQEKRVQVNTLYSIGKWLTIFLLSTAFLLTIFSHYFISFLILAGVWGAVSYSLPPFRLSYKPFAGEWLSLFPSLFFLGAAGPWIALGYLPEWALQNAVINALFCMSWVMVHHIPDLEADRQASPVKRTSVVWFVNHFDIRFARFPAVIYLLLTGLCAFWLGIERVWAAGGLVFFISISLIYSLFVDPKDPEKVTRLEKLLLLLAVLTAIWLGIFV